VSFFVFEQIMAFITLFPVLAQNTPNRVSTGVKMPAKGTNTPTLRVHAHQQMLKLLPASYK
jgi:hypothetical protein